MNDYPAIIWGSRTIHQSRLEQYIAAAMKHLKGRGLEAKDKAVIIENNSIEYVILLLAMWRMGVVACPLNPKWPLETLVECSKALGPKVVLTNNTGLLHSKKFIVPVVELRDLISFDARQQLAALKSDIPLTNTATIIWTSGSSALPKAAVHTWGNHFYSAKGSQNVIPLSQKDRWVLSLPLYHVSGISIVVRCYLAQAAIIIQSPEDELVDVLRKSKATHISLVSTQLYRLLEDKENLPILKSLQYILLGGSAIPAALIDKALFHELPVYTSYGMTETSSQVATGKVEAIDKPHAKVLPYREVKIDDQGQILIKGEVLFKGYYNQSKITLPLTPDGWFETRDTGILENGYLTVQGRMDHMFISAGENIQPEEIEGVILRIPQVRQAIVVAKEDKEFGFRPIAFVRFHGPFNKQLLLSHCVQYLPKIKVPVEFYAWPEELQQGIKVSRKFFQERLGNLLEE